MEDQEGSRGEEGSLVVLVVQVLLDREETRGTVGRMELPVPQETGAVMELQVKKETLACRADLDNQDQEGNLVLLDVPDFLVGRETVVKTVRMQWACLVTKVLQESLVGTVIRVTLECLEGTVTPEKEEHPDHLELEELRERTVSPVGLEMTELRVNPEGR